MNLLIENFILSHLYAWKEAKKKKTNWGMIISIGKSNIAKIVLKSSEFIDIIMCWANI